MEEDSLNSTRSTLHELTELNSLEICQRFNELSTMDAQRRHKERRVRARPRGLADRPVQLGADYRIDTASFICKFFISIQRDKSSRESKWQALVAKLLSLVRQRSVLFTKLFSADSIVTLYGSLAHTNSVHSTREKFRWSLTGMCL